MVIKSSFGLLVAITVWFCPSFVHGKIDANDPTAATFIGAVICTEEPFHTAEWFKCIMCCQAINPYHFKIPSEPNIEARKIFLDHATGLFDGDGRSSCCLAQPAYNQILKEKVLEMKANLKAECADDAGMLANFQKKLDCFEWCKVKRSDYSAANAKFCPEVKIF